MKRNKTLFYSSLIAIAAGLLFFPSHALAEEQAAPPIATGTTVIATDTTQIQPEYSGWQNVDGQKYYFNPETHQKVTGEQEIDHVFYLFDWNGVQKTGWRTVNSKRVYFDPETGAMQTGWISVYDSRYHADANGKQTGEIQVNGTRYLLDNETGKQHTGFCTFSDGTISYYAEDGTIQNGWIDSRYGRSFSKNGILQTGWQTIDGKKFYFTEKGFAQTGWKQLDNNRYFFKSNGEMQTGWLCLDKTYYYFTKDGKNVSGWQNIDGKRYYFVSGTALMGWQTLDGETYYFTRNGITTGDAVIDGKTYHFGQTGCMTPQTIAWQQADGAEQQRSKYLIGIRRWDNYVWTVCGENDQTIANSACGIFSVINSVYYKKNVFLDPITIADWTKANGYRTAHAGVDVRFFPAYLKTFGKNYGVQYAGQLYSVDAALQHVRNGGTICANIPGHWISVVDYDKKTGKYLLLDSAASYPRTQTIQWQSTGVAWVSASEFTQNSAYRFFVSGRRVYALTYGK